MAELILASTSPWRRRILADAGLHCRVVPPEVDESIVVEADPVERVEALARAKASAVAARVPEAWVLGADQLLFDDSGVYGKPTSPEDHRARLVAMRGRTHALVTGFCLLGPGFCVLSHEITRMVVRADLTDAEIAAYVATGEGSGCAGGYAAEGRGAFLFSRVDGDWFNVLGLPLFQVMDALRAHGWRFSA